MAAAFSFSSCFLSYRPKEKETIAGSRKNMIKLPAALSKILKSQYIVTLHKKIYEGTDF
jgi:hypothetical protein